MFYSTELCKAQTSFSSFLGLWFCWIACAGYECTRKLDHIPFFCLVIISPSFPDRCCEMCFYQNEARPYSLYGCWTLSTLNGMKYIWRVIVKNILLLLCTSHHPFVWQWMLLEDREVKRCCLCLVMMTQLRRGSVPPSGCATDSFW